MCGVSIDEVGWIHFGVRLHGASDDESFRFAGFCGELSFCGDDSISLKTGGQSVVLGCKLLGFTTICSEFKQFNNGFIIFAVTTGLLGSDWFGSLGNKETLLKWVCWLCSLGCDLPPNFTLP